MLSLEEFKKSLAGIKSGLTIQAYGSDLTQFFAWLTETDYTVTSVERIGRNHIEDYFAHLVDKGQTGTTRARKLISLQVFFACLVEKGILPHSPSEKIKRPRREQKTKQYLRPDEYSPGVSRGSRRSARLLYSASVPLNRYPGTLLIPV